jgi:hypothetical protein
MYCLQYNVDRKRKESSRKARRYIMKAEVRFYEKGFASAEVPEIEELREEIEVESRKDLVEAAKGVELPAAAEYAHIYVGGEPVIGITSDGVRDFEADEWIVEPESEE